MYNWKEWRLKSIKERLFVEVLSWFAQMAPIGYSKTIYKHKTSQAYCVYHQARCRQFVPSLASTNPPLVTLSICRNTSRGSGWQSGRVIQSSIRKLGVITELSRCLFKLGQKLNELQNKFELRTLMRRALTELNTSQS